MPERRASFRPSPAVEGATLLLGCDFSSAPNRRKPIVLALGRCSGTRVSLEQLVPLTSLSALGEWLQRPQSWVGAFDLPFGLPRELVQFLGWPDTWRACIDYFCQLPRAEVRRQLVSFCAQRPAGQKFAHRATDRPAGSSPSMKWVNPPVVFMLHAGLPLLLRAGVALPGLWAGSVDALDAQGRPLRVALEAYPGLLAREVLGRRSYKSDDRHRQTPERLLARKDLITALELGQTRLGLTLKLTHAQRDALADDARGDALDAVLCLMQAAWAWRRAQAGDMRYGLPPDMDPLEGWIVTA